jgi:alpha-L-fucosidase
MNAASTRPGTRALCAALALLAAPPVQAQVVHTRQDFLRRSVAGLFLHWGMRTSPQHTSCSAWEADVTNGGWNASYWVNEAKKLHAQYLVLATFHSRLGYARPWPSAIPGSCRTGRDFLGELIGAASAQGLRVILYMTDDPKWFNEGLPAGQSWLDSAAYSAFKGRSVDLHTRDGFGEFSYDLFVEVMQRYPNLAGFWIDNDNAYWERNGLYQRVRADRPSFTLSNNNEDTAIMDMISNEQKTGMMPAYDYPQAVFTAAPRMIEADFKLPSSGGWWFTGVDSAVDSRLTLGRLITNAGSSVKALMAETAQVNGRFPANQEAFNNFANSFLTPIWESLSGTEGGGYLHGGLKPGFWNDGAHGVTTVSRSNPDLHYVHVITRPSGSTLRIRDNSYRVLRVRNLRTGADVDFGQDAGTLTLSGISSWDAHDTVFKVETAGRQGIIPSSSITALASAAAAGHPAGHALDGSYTTFWDNNKTLPASLRFDLGSSERVQFIGLNQREDSVSYARSATEGSARIRDFRVFVSNDGVNWGSPIRTGTLPSHRGVAIVDLPATTTRHVRLEVLSTWAASTDTARFQRLRVDEAWIGSEYAVGDGASIMRLEAENATLSQATVASNHSGFSGTGFVDYANVVGSFVEWVVDAPRAASANLRLRFANGTAANRPMDVRVNGVLVADEAAFAGTGAWDSWQIVTLGASLGQGRNLVRATATTASGGPNVDFLEVELLDSPVARSFEGEASGNTFSGSAAVAGCAGCSGGQKVRFIGNSPANHVTINGVSVAAGGNHQVTIAGTVDGTRTFFVSANGGPAVQATLTGTSFATPVTTTITIALNAGGNSLRFFNDGAFAPDLDRITVR